MRTSSEFWKNLISWSNIWSHWSTAATQSADATRAEFPWQFIAKWKSHFFNCDWQIFSCVKRLNLDSRQLSSSEMPLWAGWWYQTFCDKSAFPCCLLPRMVGYMFLAQRPQLACNWTVNAMACRHAHVRKNSSASVCLDRQGAPQRQKRSEEDGGTGQVGKTAVSKFCYKANRGRCASGIWDIHVVWSQ